jgi:hypothetical protein
MPSNEQLIIAITGVFPKNAAVKKAGLRLVRVPRSLDDEIDEMNHEFTVTRNGKDTGHYVSIGMGIASLDSFDGEAVTHHTYLARPFGASATLAFVQEIADKLAA